VFGLEITAISVLRPTGILFHMHDTVYGWGFCFCLIRNTQWFYHCVSYSCSWIEFHTAWNSWRL